MRIGFCSLYSWRPHVEHLHFLANLARRAGHEAHFLSCDGDLPVCYTRAMRDRPAWRECLECRAGGIRSYEKRNVSSLGRHLRAGAVHQSEARREWAHSSASTLGRFESDEDYGSQGFTDLVDQLEPVVRMSYAAARDWIESRRLDAVCVFNGRMDATRSILEAARSLNVRLLSVERTWLGDGLHLLPDENCLGLQAINRLVGHWKDIPLTESQARRAATFVARRFLGTNVREWRAYNTGAHAVSWPVADAARRILLIPSSRNEVWGHPDWQPHWTDATAGYDAIIERLNLRGQDMVLRCHPNWGEKIGSRDGSASEHHYTDWARKRGVHCIGSTDRASTMSLLAECDAVVLANGSAAMEAGFLGKQVISIAPSIYQAAGIRTEALTPEDLASLHLWSDLPESERAQKALQIARQTLRFLFTMIYRVPQYTREVRADSTTRFRYSPDADPTRFVELLRTGELRADDESRAADSEGESIVLQMIRSLNWQNLARAQEIAPSDWKPLRRRWSRRPVDWLGRRKPVGDR